MASFHANADRPFPLGRLPRELIDCIFSYYMSIEEPFEYLIPFSTASSLWFDLVHPSMWANVCLNAITSEDIKPAKRQQAHTKQD
ncbi:hypothetical protein CGMCC3_g17492 [Colletotrichum fructicola]|nr:uncharacterized protein CGMCC3_g17492 [Colletotrichum fructicola]KAE9566356.1 hypothetical protein CGMCC3_g17492 [Colletotrichum fructicola]